MKTTQHILSKIKAYSQDYLHNDQDIQVIYQNLCNQYGVENIHDEVFFYNNTTIYVPLSLLFAIEEEVELFFNN